MQMNIVEASLNQRGSLPLPSAALVIDMRGVEDDDLINRLHIEIMDLASEMKVHEINHWRHLTEFLSFRAIPPLRSEDIKTIYTQQNLLVMQEQPKPKKGATSNKAAQSGLTGRIEKARQVSAPLPFDGEGNGLASEESPFNVFQQHIEELAQEINRIRNNRIAAVADLNKSGIPGRSTRDATVRVIFLTEAENPESLVSVAHYTAKLKEHFGKLERGGHQPMVSTTVLCLNNSGEAGPPTDLIQGLRWNDDWKHIDSLLISEQFREDAALIEGAMQTYLAELLLYVLLIIPPLTVDSLPDDEHQPVALLEDAGIAAPNGKWIHLPASSYLVGMAAIEHSARWGRRWINYGIAARAIEILQNREAEDDLARRRIRNVVDAWLRNWFRQVAQAIPDKIPGHIPALNAISNATNISNQKDKVIITQGVSPSMSKAVLRDLRAYLSSIVETYTTPPNQGGTVQRGTVGKTDTPTLQDAVDSIPQIEQRLREWEDRDPALKKGTPLVNAQLEAQRVLSSPNFFTGVKGSIPRARTELKELSSAISDFKNVHEQNVVNLDERRDRLEKRGTTLINDLEEHANNIPLLATRFRLKQVMALLIFVLIFCLGVFITFFGIAWLRHLVFLKFPSFLPGLDTLILVNTSIFAYVFWAILLIFVLAAIIVFGRSFFKDTRTGTEVEFTFVITLLVGGLVIWLISFSIDQLVDDPKSLALLAWFSFVQPFNLVCLTLAIVIFVIECIWFVWWRNRLLEESDRIVNELQTTHSQDIDHVTNFITEVVGLQILMGTGLTDSRGGPGPYYARVDQLYKRLNEIAREANQQQKLAAHRLVMSMSETQPGTDSSSIEPWLNLRIREEWLDVNSLADGYKRLQEQLNRESVELREFSELLLRVMGKESANELEQQFRERTFGNREQNQVRVFLTTLIAMATRFSIAPQSVASLAPIIERYDNFDDQYVQQQPALGALIEMLNTKVREATIQPLIADDSSDGDLNMTNTPDIVKANITLATDAFAAWGQILWENKDGRLDKALTRSGVLAKLMESDEYDARAIMRRLQVRTVLFGRSISYGQVGEIRLILSPSAQSRAFRQSLSIPSRFIIDFPDIERLLLFYIQRYKADPLFVPDPGQDTDVK
jgi:hypothetical protein